jgi:hypothetical protein
MGGIDADVQIAVGPEDRVRLLAGGAAIYLGDSPDGAAFPAACRLALPEPGEGEIQAQQVGPDGVAHVIALWSNCEFPTETRAFYLAIP